MPTPVFQAPTKDSSCYFFSPAGALAPPAGAFSALGVFWGDFVALGAPAFAGVPVFGAGVLDGPPQPTVNIPKLRTINSAANFFMTSPFRKLTGMGGNRQETLLPTTL